MARSKIIKNSKALPKNKVIKKYKRANGEGTIYQRKDGRWAGAVTIGYDENGKQIKKTVYGRNQTEVAKKLSDISGRLKSNSYEVIEKKTFEELMSEWLLVFKKSAVSPRTFEGIIRNYRLHIEPIIGKMKIYEIDTFVVQQVINKLIDGDYSLNVIKKNKHLFNIHFHGLRHTFSNMLFEMNENPKVIQQLLGHRDVKTTVHTKNRRTH